MSTSQYLTRATNQLLVATRTHAHYTGKAIHNQLANLDAEAILKHRQNVNQYVDWIHAKRAEYEFLARYFSYLRCQQELSFSKAKPGTAELEIHNKINIWIKKQARRNALRKLREEYPKARTHWSSEEESELKQELAKVPSQPWATIASKLKRTPLAIKAKARDLRTAAECQAAADRARELHQLAAQAQVAQREAKKLSAAVATKSISTVIAAMAARTAAKGKEKAI